MTGACGLFGCAGGASEIATSLGRGARVQILWLRYRGASEIATGSGRASSRRARRSGYGIAAPRRSRLGA